MRKIKNIFLVALTAVIGFALVACNQTKEYTAHVFFWNFADPFVAGIRQNLEREFKAADIKYTLYDGQNDQTKQNEQIDTAISSGASILVLNLVQSETGEAVLKKAKDKNIPAVFFNRQPPAAIFAGEKDAILLDGDMIGGAKAQGVQIAEYLLKDYEKYAKADGVIDYVMIRAELSHEAATARTIYSVSAANEVLKAAGKPELKRVDGAPQDLLADDWSAAKGKEQMQTLITKVKVEDIDLVIANNDGIAEGVISALNDVDYNKGDAAKFIPVFGYDATDSGKDLVKQGKLAGTILQDANANATIIRTIVANHKAGNDYIAGSDLKYEGTFNRLVIVDVAYDPELHK